MNQPHWVDWRACQTGRAVCQIVLVNLDAPKNVL
jgi:hypothetical protein